MWPAVASESLRWPPPRHINSHVSLSMFFLLLPHDSERCCFFQEKSAEKICIFSTFGNLLWPLKRKLRVQISVCVSVCVCVIVRVAGHAEVD